MDKELESLIKEKSNEEVVDIFRRVKPDAFSSDKEVDEIKGNRGVFLKWWLFNAIVIVGVSFALAFDLFSQLWEKDVTKLSFVIIFMYLFMSVWCGVKTFKISKIISFKNVNQQDLKDVASDEEVGWFVSDLMTSIGMIGTVIGFIIMLGSIHMIDTSNIRTIKEMFNTLGSGMAIALLTTLVGLICSLLLKIQYFNLSKSIEENLIEEK